MIPFNKPYVPSESEKYLKEVLKGAHHQGDGPFTHYASELISKLVGGGKVFLTPSCTDALEMASLLANIGVGDEVIIPAYTFTSAAIAVTQFGATPVFVDIDPITKGIDVEKARNAISDRSVAISWVNYAGIAPDIEGIQKLAREFDLLMIEDNAHGLGGSYKGKPLGSFGDFSTLSFHATKNIQCGEGGALVVNNPSFIGRAEIIREKGTDRTDYLRGDVKKYQWVDKGSSYLLPEVLAAILCGQLENFKDIQQNRNMTWNKYSTSIVPLMNKSSIMQIRDIDKNVAHIFYILMDTAIERDLMLRALETANIIAATHYQSLDKSIGGVKYGKSVELNNVSHSVSERLLRLPIWSGPGLNSDAITDCVQKYLS